MEATQVKTQLPLLKRNGYFVCGKDLFRVVDVSEENILIENCMTLDIMWFPWENFERVEYRIIEPCGGV